MHYGSDWVISDKSAAIAGVGGLSIPLSIMGAKRVSLSFGDLSPEVVDQPAD